MSYELKTFRDTAFDYSPLWLRGTWLRRLVYTIGLHLDAMIDWANAAVHLRFPSWCRDNLSQGLAILGRERGFRKGLVESDAAYAERLRLWLVDRKRKGTATALLSQLAGYLTGYAVKMRVVNNQGAWVTRNTDGSFEYYYSPNARYHWNWDGKTTTGWSRYWIILYPPRTLWVPTTSWYQVWGVYATGTIGTTATPAQWDDLRAIVADWNPPHARCAGIIMAFDAASFEPTDASDWPHGTWGEWGYGTTNYRQVRLSTARYGSGLGEGL